MQVDANHLANQIIMIVLNLQNQTIMVQGPAPGRSVEITKVEDRRSLNGLWGAGLASRLIGELRKAGVNCGIKHIELSWETTPGGGESSRTSEAGYTKLYRIYSKHL